MILKRYSNFINESNNDRILRAEKYIQEELGCVLVNGRYDSDMGIIIGYKEAELLFYKTELLVPFGAINGDFSVSNRNITKISKNLPTHVKGSLHLDHNHIKSLKGFNTKVDVDLNLSHNHLHKLENLPDKINGKLKINGNMLTSLEGCPQEVGSFYAEENWFKDLSNAPKKVNEFTDVSNGWNDSSNKTIEVKGIPGGDIRIDYKKIPTIERSFYKEFCYKGITNYWTELLSYIIEKEKENDITDFSYIMSIDFPEHLNVGNLKKSAKSINKFNI